MSQQHRIFLSLGSNLGNKSENLQHALEALYKRVGDLRSISSVYKTGAQGFESHDFLNACVEIHTTLTPEKLLQNCLEIESDMGRKRSLEKGYEARIIDVDILLYDQFKIETASLEIPHPALHRRNFVLKPLAEIAADILHPVFQKRMIDLLENGDFPGVIQKTGISLTNPKSRFDFNKRNYIAIEGNIGSGKTTLASQIAEDFNAKLILERFADNPFLPKFYEKPARYAFPLELSFLADRYQQFSDDVSQFDLFSDFLISDYDIYKSLIFSKITLAEDEFLLYKKFFEIIYKDAVKPDLYVFLYQNTARLLDNIRKRGRSYEQRIAPDYLDKINSGYLEFIKTLPTDKSLIIDVSDMDFVENRSAYLYILEKISRA
ncbi:MAG: 2-amino-4-hydroxy-6-hydroxymethyldihydropteridine diphosphokinase [Bacteroidetes bacterium]|nr:2-amino-4-hydroxy-6-hydroxymethyldihydropteridine diphosphokinase [Bacteroidota bacterium]